MSGITSADYADALQVQNACNLSGVVRSFCDVMTRIREESDKLGVGTDWVRTHPIAVLYADKIADLTGARRDYRVFGAYRACTEGAAGKPVGHCVEQLT